MEEFQNILSVFCSSFFEYKNNKNFNVFCFQSNILCIIFCRIFNIKIIVRPNSSPSGWSENFIKKIFSKVLSWSNIVIVNSLEFKKELKKNLILKVFVFIIR